MEKDGPEMDRWALTLPPEITSDLLWRVSGYRLSLYLAEGAWDDAGALRRHPLGRAYVRQLLRSVASISANIAEGYSMATSANRARYFEIACGSAREARDWYVKCRHVLGSEVAAERITLTTRIIRFLIVAIRERRTMNDK